MHSLMVKAKQERAANVIKRNASFISERLG